MERLIKLFSTFFYVGMMPFAPGTLGSFAGLLVFLSAKDAPLVCAALFALITGLGFFSAGRAEKIFGKKDPGEVVIDEVAGIFIVFFMVPVNTLNLLAGFVLYRVLDIFKPFPARRLEGLRGSLGIMSDDLVCGLYANIILQVLLKLNILH
jgi:phosphatidylglycerophosphatase A